MRHVLLGSGGDVDELADDGEWCGGGGGGMRARQEGRPRTMTWSTTVGEAACREGADGDKGRGRRHRRGGDNDEGRGGGGGLATETGHRCQTLGCASAKPGWAASSCTKQPHIFVLIYVDDVNKIRDGIILCQEKYASDLLKKVGMSDSKSISTPRSISEKLSLHEGSPLGPVDSTNYRSIAGALQYLTLTRPDIAFPVNKVCQFLHAPTTEHWASVRGILRYVKHRSKLGLKICKSSTMLVSAYSDAH
ncbi:hypothetical protein U9M48_019203 [Paspalum notatum var. saurae]|uniref:Reverse transcriptase Ty1/copia-type domain-containing protein n=1 Tax=Paspalum notatum var. saurae TaxID=547442 RepID=A0AAQ3TAZ3_PASNO